MDVARISTMSIIELFGCAEEMRRAGQAAALPALYRAWIVRHPADPALHAAYFNYATALDQVGDRDGTVMALRDAVRLKPDFLQAHLNLGLALEKVGQKGPAVSQWLTVANALSVVDGDSVAQRAMAFENIGRALESSDVDAAAEDALRQRLELKLDDKVVQHWIALRMRQCKWPAAAGTERIGRRELLADISPLSLANLADDPMFQLATAARYNGRLVGVQPRLPGLPTPAEARARAPRKLRIGYVSSDLREHAVGFSIVETLELHDRDRFEVHAYYCGIPREDGTKARIRAAVDGWTDIGPLSDLDAARRIRDDGIDILVDLNGYTKDARTRVFSHRPAPVAVNWFGFPSTMGSPYHHYLIADEHAIPAHCERFFSERVMRLPCYQPNDRRRAVSAAAPTRVDEGLPAEAVVFCCLNGLQKLTESTFARWLTILGQVGDGVLWLLGGTADTQARLRAVAARRGVAPERIVFAAKTANPDHVARYALADLFLDNMPYGAHTTASDALWMGVPVLTFPGRSFASRICSSLVSAAGLGDLVCPTADAYVARAIALGRDRGALAELKRRLAVGRDGCLLFDTPRLVAGLEALYAGMWDDFTRGALPVPDLGNLDLYHAIGTGMEVEAAEGLSDDAYVRSWVERLAVRHDTYPIPGDVRLWPEPAPAPVSRPGAS